MNKDLKYIEMAIVILASNHNPTILNPDFLKRNGIVPEEWELAQNPICTDPISLVAFKPGTRVSMELNKVVFVETDVSNLPFATNLAEIAKKFINTLKHVKYRAIGFNPKAVLIFPDQSSLRSYVARKFLKTGPWSNLEGFESGTNLSLIYNSSSVNITLNVEEAVGKKEEAGKTALLFRGNWHHDLDAGDHDRSIEQLNDFLNNWQTEVKSFSDLAGTIVKE